MATASRSVEPPCVAPGWDAADLNGLPPTVVETITQARAPSTRKTYALKWSLFANWCSSRREDPRRCTIGVVLSFLQERLERRLSPSTLKCMWPLSRPTMMQWTTGPWESMISSWGSWRVPGGWTPPGHPLCPLWTSLSSWLDFRLPDCANFHQKGRGPPSVFGKWRVPCVRAGLLSRCLETLAWIRAQGSDQALLRSGGEPASTALRGGRSSLSVAVSRKSIAHIRGPHPELQKFWAALCLPQRSAEMEGCLQTEAGPLDSGCRRLGVPISRWAVPPGGEGSLHSECCLLPCIGARTPLWQTSAELRAGRHRTPSQDSTVSALSQSLPVCWVTVMGGKNWPVSRLLRHSPSPWDTSAFFLLQFSSPDGEPWWNPLSTPGSQTGWSSLSPGPVLVLARPGLRSATVLG